jgi:hypothetical protein
MDEKIEEKTEQESPEATSPEGLGNEETTGTESANGLGDTTGSESVSDGASEGTNPVGEV